MTVLDLKKRLEKKRASIRVGENIRSNMKWIGVFFRPFDSDESKRSDE